MSSENRAAHALGRTFPGGMQQFVALMNAKAAMLGVDPRLISERGAVSEEVAGAIADGSRTNAQADFALATTGIAGPSGGTEEKPVGTVFIALAAEGRPTKIERRFFPDDRPTFKELATQTALEMLRRRLLE